MVSEFREVFPTDLLGMPLDRDIDFCIDLDPCTHPISIPPYCIAPAKLKDLKAQIQELLDKGFLRPSASPWGVPVMVCSSTEGVMVDPQKIEVVKNWIRPSYVTAIRSFVGLASYYRRYAKNFASIATHMTMLTKKEVTFEWTEKCEERFQKLKTLLTTTHNLALPVKGKDFIVYCDSSNFGLDVVLRQDKNVRAYASRQLKEHKRNYS
ncbi:hypothetical protein MTR67_051965 [Solanum verrucosum]|uniref:Reverse transcriptase/retrotransposon-derived protein RNase H-like domain-containing protein n=1 Tax=Solanum verrucosum TaxID=315347 RepID=A0AAF1A2W4_SOLVR|nr:hypothetical protein MTR67_051965 [Solanum verrucosum]